MPEVNKASYWIRYLQMETHPEGGHFKEIYRSPLRIDTNMGERNIATSIYYLLQEGECSKFHRLSSDEIWYFHGGDPVEIYMINDKGELSKTLVGLKPEEQIFPQITIKKGNWFAARSTGIFTLVGCQVAPGFDFADFEMANAEKLVALFPQHKTLIEQFY